MIAVVPPWEVARVQRWAPDAKAYDFVKNSSCEEALTEERLFDIYRRTHANR